MQSSSFRSLVSFALPLGLALACGQQDKDKNEQVPEAASEVAIGSESANNAGSAELGEGTALSRAPARPEPRYILRQAKGLQAADIQKAVDRFRDDLGGANNLGAPGTQPQGHREINWDGVPADRSAPQAFPGDFFKARGALFKAAGRLQVSAKASDTIEVAFSNINPTFSELFRFFSPEKLFSPVDRNKLEVSFTVPGSDQPATINGFGAVFTDVDVPGHTRMEFYDSYDQKILTVPVPAVKNANGSLSFVGVKLVDGQRIAKVRMKLGNVALSAFQGEYSGQDAVATDDFLYAEPVEIPGRL